MECGIFKKSIGNFASRPLLHDKLVLQHKEQNSDCKCNIELLVMTEDKK